MQDVDTMGMEPVMPLPEENREVHDPAGEEAPHDPAREEAPFETDDPVTPQEAA